MSTSTRKPTTKKPSKAAESVPKAKPKIVICEGQALREIAAKMKIKPKDLIDRFAAKGRYLTVNDLMDEPLAETISKETGFDVQFLTIEQDARLQAEAQPGALVARPPVVTIMGHVDHGKTTLLDAIRSSNLVDKESGGITQHIGAYRVIYKTRPITFVDTPGHEAFTRLRSRGAKVTDIVVLVVAADDGIMPQTKEAINHARAANVPIIVAINKTDKLEANIDRVKQQLSKEGLLIEEWGGKTISVEISAKEKKNIDELLEMILLLGDIIEIKANSKAPAQGVILEARLDSQKGPVGTVIIQHGTLAQGQAFLSGTAYGRVRALFDERGKVLKAAGPSVPVEILGFSEVPSAGDFFLAVPDLETAKRIALQRLLKLKKESAPPAEHITLDELFKKVEQGQVKELALIIRADVQGSVEVLMDLLPSLATDKVKIKIVHAATGNITEADVLLASASNAVVVGYNVRPGQKMLDLAKKESVEIRNYNIIYELTDDIKKAIVGMLEPVIKETFLGRAEVRKVFQIPKVGTIAGCFVQDGRISRNAEIRVFRNKAVVFQGRISSLKHVKENVTEVKKDSECGIGLAGFQAVEAGDIIEAFVREKVKAE
jgi:translation initiation factor IF-2